jgi:methylthioribose-1-phosphate isomerase
VSSEPSLDVKIADLLNPVGFDGDAPGRLWILDQSLLPGERKILTLDSVEAVHAAIHRLAVRGAPAIGIAGAYGVVVAAQSLPPDLTAAAALPRLEEMARRLAAARPTAVNLAWAIDEVMARVRARASENPGLTALGLAREALVKARELDENNKLRCERIGRFGAELLKSGDVVYTHCNAGPLATAGIGTALGVLAVAARQGKRLSAFAAETRPLLQGARLTSYELRELGIPVRLVTDGMAAHVFANFSVSAVLVGADRIAANGDTANKIGTHSLAVVAQHYGVPLYVAAPLSTFDLSIPDGKGIPIEERVPEEITEFAGRRVAPHGVGVFNPAFDVTPAPLIRGIITEAGIASPPSRETIRALFTKPS